LERKYYTQLLDVEIFHPHWGGGGDEEGMLERSWGEGEAEGERGKIEKDALKGGGSRYWV